MRGEKMIPKLQIIIMCPRYGGDYAQHNLSQSTR